MADKSFGAKKVELIGATGTPKIDSASDLNINANQVSISTDVSIGGTVRSNLIVGTGYSVAIDLGVNPGPQGPFQVGTYFTVYNSGDSKFSGEITATRFIGDGSSLTGVTTAGSVGGTPLNTPNTLIQRDGSGGFSAGIVSATTVTATTVTATTLNATNFVGSGSSLTNIIPSGIIVMWSGTTIPTGWLLCDGTNSTPDLRNRFIVGANNNSKTGITTQAGPTFDVSTGVRDSVYDPGDVGGETSHQLTIAELAAHTHGRGAIYPGSGPEQNQSGSAEDRTSFNQQTTSTGGDEYHENRPPYYALAFIMKA